VISPPQLGPLFIIQSNNIINIIWAGPGTLQYSASLAGGSWTNLINAVSPYPVQTGVAQQFFRLAE